MLPILTPEESSALDRAAEQRGTKVDELMEKAGRAVARVAVTLTGGAYGRRAVVLCGKGNNGGDGLVAARHLDRWGVGVTVLLLADPGDLKGPAARNFERFVDAGGRWHRFGPTRLVRELERCDAVVDAMVGTGFLGTVEGDLAAAISAVNEAALPVVAADVPSGVEGSTGAVRSDAIRATATVTFGSLKPGVMFFPGAEHAGDVEVADIGFPPDLVRSQLWLVEAADLAGWLRPRPAESSKRTSGVVLVLAGSRAMTGAAALAATAAYRAGAGLVTLAVPESILPVVEGAVHEATFLPLPETDEGTVSMEGWPALQKRLEGVDAVAVGPGLTTNPETAELVSTVVAEAAVPMVLDADGLNAFAGRGAVLAERRSPLVITPHPGEFGRLTGLTQQQILDDRVGHARKASHEFGCAVLLKGSRSVVAEPDGTARVNPTGGSFLATAGTGDVLTGTTAAFLARGVKPGDAVAAAAFVHGLAGRMAAQELGDGTMASDVLARLPEAISRVAQAAR